MSGLNYTYFQYQKEEALPVFIRVNLADFDTSLLSFLAQMRFEELSEKEVADLEPSLTPDFSGNVLTIQLASPGVCKQIDQVTESDRHGVECITPKEGYKVYRFKKRALMVYSFGVGYWEMGCKKDFGNAEDAADYRSIINRYLSWALVPQGIVGFWGVPVEEGLVILKRGESQGEAVFFDVRERKVYSLDGVSPMKSGFSVLRLDSTLKDRNIPMTHEQLLSFLTVNSTFFDYAGLSVPVRQAIQGLARVSQGLVHPRDSFKPRTDLSL